MVKIPKLKQQLKSCGNEKQQQNIAEKKWTKLKRSRSKLEEIEKPNQRAPNIKNKVENKKKKEENLKSARR